MVHGTRAVVPLPRLCRPSATATARVGPDHVAWPLDKPSDDAYRYTLDARIHDLEALLDHRGCRATSRSRARLGAARLRLAVKTWSAEAALVLNTAASLPRRGLPRSRSAHGEPLWVPPRAAQRLARRDGTRASRTRDGSRWRRAFLAPYDSFAPHAPALRGGHPARRERPGYATYATGGLSSFANARARVLA